MSSIKTALPAVVVGARVAQRPHAAYGDGSGQYVQRAGAAQDIYRNALIDTLLSAARHMPRYRVFWSMTFLVPKSVPLDGPPCR